MLRILHSNHLSFYFLGYYAELRLFFIFIIVVNEFYLGFKNIPNVGCKGNIIIYNKSRALHVVCNRSLEHETVCNTTLTNKCLEFIHDSTWGGHSGVDKTNNTGSKENLTGQGWNLMWGLLYVVVRYASNKRQIIHLFVVY